MEDKFQDKIIQSDIDEDIVYKENKKERYSLILDKMNEKKTPSSNPSISLTPQSYVNKNSLLDNQTSVIEYIDEKADLSRHDAGSTAENLEKLKYFWNSSVGLIADFILDNFQNSYLDDESNIMPKKDGKQMGVITKRDIVAADAEETNEVGNAVRPLINIDGETYDRVRNQDYDLKKDSSGNYIPHPYGLADKSRDLFNLPIEDPSNLTYTRKKEENSDNNYGTRLIMPKNVRRVEIEDLNRNFWVIAQSIMTIGNYIFEDGPFSQIIYAFSTEIIQLWENTLYLWIRIYYEHNHAAKDNIILTLPVPADGVLTSNKYNSYYVIPDSDSSKLMIDGESLPEEDEIKVIIINRLSYLIDKYPQSNICVIPYIRLNNYKHNYFTSIYYPGIYFYLRKQNRAYFKFFKKNNDDRFIIKYDDYCSMLAAISQDQNEYLYPASLTEFYLEDKSTPFYAGIRPQITEEAKIEITNDGYILKNFSLQLWDMVDSANRQRWNSTSCLVIFEAQDINLLDEKEKILLSSKGLNEGREKREKSKNIEETQGAEYPYYLGEIPSKRRKTSKNGDYRIMNLKYQVSAPEKIMGGFTAPIFLFNEDFRDYITINKTGDNINFFVKIPIDRNSSKSDYYILKKATQISLQSSTYYGNGNSTYLPDHKGIDNKYYDPQKSTSGTSGITKTTRAKAFTPGSVEQAMKKHTFNDFIAQYKLIGEKEEYWGGSDEKAKEKSLEYLIDNINIQDTITSSNGEYQPFIRKKPDSDTKTYYENLHVMHQTTFPRSKVVDPDSQHIYKIFETDSRPEIFFPNPDSDSSTITTFVKTDPMGPIKENTIWQEMKNKINNYDEIKIEDGFDLKFFKKFFLTQIGSSGLLYTSTDIGENAGTGNQNMDTYGGNDPRGYGIFGVLAILARYGAARFPLPYYWMYLLDNKNELSIYDEDKTLNELKNQLDLTQKKIVETSDSYDNDFNSLKIHPFFTFSKAGIKKEVYNEGYKISLVKEYLTKVTFFIEKDYLQGFQTQDFNTVVNDKKEIIGYSIDWENLNLDVKDIKYEDIKFGQPQFLQYYEAEKFSNEESWYNTFFNNLTTKDKFPDSLDSYLAEHFDGVSHYYIQRKGNENAMTVENSLNDDNRSGEKRIVSEKDMKNYIVNILTRKVESKLIFPCVCKNKKYNLTLLTREKDGEKITIADFALTT